jgi:hypothetical protein
MMPPSPAPRHLLSLCFVTRPESGSRYIGGCAGEWGRIGFHILMLFIVHSFPIFGSRTRFSDWSIGLRSTSKAVLDVT